MNTTCNALNASMLQCTHYTVVYPNMVPRHYHNALFMDKSHKVLGADGGVWSHSCPILNENNEWIRMYQCITIHCKAQIHNQTNLNCKLSQGKVGQEFTQLNMAAIQNNNSHFNHIK